MKKILVPVDFSSLCRKALSVAVQLSQKTDAEILLMHMIEPSNSELGDLSNPTREQSEFLRNSALNRLDDFKASFPKAKITTVVKEFKVFSEIDALAKAHEVDLIVMGSNGSKGAKEVFFGSNTEKVVRTATMPVLVVKTLGFEFGSDQAVFSSDLTEESVRTLQKAVEFCDLASMKLKIVHVTESIEPLDFETEANLATIENKLPAGAEIELIQGQNVEEALLSYARQNGTHLIIVPTHGRKGLAHFFRGSIGEDIANHAAQAVLTIRI